MSMDVVSGHAYPRSITSPCLDDQVPDDQCRSSFGFDVCNLPPAPRSAVGQQS